MSDQLKKSIAQYTQGRTPHPIAHQLDGRKWRQQATPQRAGTEIGSQPPDDGETNQFENTEAGSDPDQSSNLSD